MSTSPASVQSGSDTPERLAYVDALRGWALLAVLLVHAAIGLTLPVPLQRLATAANYGVQLFFVVSAFTLLSSFRARATRDRNPILAFLTRRFFRIAPMFWLAIAVYTAHDGLGPRGAAPHGISWLQLSTTAAFVHGWRPDTINAVVPGGWSIAVEMNFYLLLPLLLLVLTSLRRVYLALGASTVASILLSVTVRRLLTRAHPELEVLAANFTYYWLPRQLPVFLLGFVLYHLEKEGRSPLHGGRWSVELAAACILGMALLGPLIPVAYLLNAVAFTWLARGLARYPVRWVVNRWTRHVGTVSYSAYLCHFLILDGLRPWVMRLRPLLGTGDSLTGTVQVVVLYTGAVLCTVAFATLTYRFVEVPMQDLGRGLIRYMCWGQARETVRSPSRGDPAVTT